MLTNERHAALWPVAPLGTEVPVHTIDLRSDAVATRTLDGTQNAPWAEQVSAILRPARACTQPNLQLSAHAAVSSVKVVLESQSFYGRRVLPYVMSEEDSVDIDTHFDVRLAEWLLEQPTKPT